MTSRDYERLSEKEFENIVILFDSLHEDDIDRIIIHLQYLRQRIQRRRDSELQYNFCDKCARTYTKVMLNCFLCGRPTRPLPVTVPYLYLLDGHPEEVHTILGLEELEKNNDDYKLHVFMNEFNTLHYIDNNDQTVDVYESDLILKLKSNPKFKDEKEIKFFIRKAMERGFIYERRSKYYSNALNREE